MMQSKDKSPSKIAMVAIGNELLDGRLVDTNSVRLAKALGPFGGTLHMRITVPDDIDAIVGAIGNAVAAGADHCVLSGGLGPTTDDLTREAVATLLDCAVSNDVKSTDALKAHYAERGLSWTPSRARQTMLPVQARVIPNPKGAAVGFVATWKHMNIIALPGVPHEFDAMLEQHVLPILGSQNEESIKECWVYGYPESDLGDLVSSLLLPWADTIRIAYRTRYPCVQLRLASAESMTLHEAFGVLNQHFKWRLFSQTQGDAAAMLVQRCKEKGLSVSTAESCTGGLASHLLTDVPGASAIFAGGAVTYANAQKTRMLGVPSELIEMHGAVSEQVASAMAQGARERFGTDLGCATTGIAGPGGERPGKPVGTVWFALSTAQRSEVWSIQRDLGRQRNKLGAAYELLLRAHAMLSEN